MDKLSEARSKKLLKVLKELGSGKNKVADFLHKEKIKGISHDCYYCPIAVFLKKNFPKALEVEVDCNTVYLTFDNSPMVCKSLPKAVRDFICDFDTGEKYGFLKK